ncbi:uncharacterized protein [Hetaerina americana]|uniref:uncharacterized protein n=1 Tax=Hetaerina americana TaxID=62018 RepID=UPI003A7F1463
MMADPDGSALVEAARVECATSPGVPEALAVIEISEDGSWETKPLSVGELSASAEGNGAGGDEMQPDFLATRDEGRLESVKIKHVTRAHSSQYYVNCPVASVRPMVQEPMSSGNGGDSEAKASPPLTRDSLTAVSESMVNGGELESLNIERSSSGALMNGGVNGVHEVGCQEPCSAEAEADTGCDEMSVSAEEVASGCGAGDGGDGVVVTESIIENKEKTKNYWEEIMLAAAASGSSPPRVAPRAEVEAAEAAEVGEAGAAEVGGGEEEPSPPAATGPKIVETVAKRPEGEEEGAAEEEGGGRRVAAWTRSETPAELKIAMELREMREREEELRRLRQELGRGGGGEEGGGEEGAGRDDSALHSIPTTDEGNCSESGADEKEGSEGKGRNDTLSPDMASLEIPAEDGSYVHRRTQSMDSTSSGHSSASGGQRPGSEYPPRRRIIVKPFTNADEDQHFREPELKDENTINIEKQSPSRPFRGLKETPIEREIRIAHEREEELRREKGIAQPMNQRPVARPEALVRSTAAPVTQSGRGPQSVQHRLATSRIQREIQETTEREKELREGGRIQTMSEDTVDSKVTRIGERVAGSGAAFEKKLHKSVSAFQVDDPPVVEEVMMSPPTNKVQEVHSAPSFPLNHSISVGSGLGGSGGGISGGGGSPFSRRFMPTLGQKGLMERFLASRGKMTCISTFNSTSPTSSTVPLAAMTQPATVLSPPSFNSSSSAKSTFTHIGLGGPNISPVVHKPLEIMTDNRQQAERVEGGAASEGVQRRGWTSAEEKIQEELKEMKMREDELRLQRAHKMAKSQPNLLSLIDGNEEESQWNEDASKPSSLYSNLSNPSLLDLDDDAPVREMHATPVQVRQKGNRRKSYSLIAHWENKIQQNN